ncbi:MAG: hypothetical protein B7W97_00775, partial [Mycobacterium sp. 20-66-4]
MWALGLASVRGRDEQDRERARTMFELSAPVGSPWPRSLAFRFVHAMETLVVGDPLDERTQVGPLASPRLAAEIA